VSAPSKPSVTLKRNVTIKAIVTDKFKDYLLFEVSQNGQQIDLQLKDLQTKKAELGAANSKLLIEQVDQQIAQLQATQAELKNRIETIKKLENDTYFSQGVIEGLVTLGEGDNLYEKLGGMEIIIKDGVVQKINPVGTPQI